MDIKLADDLWARGAGHVISAQALVRQAEKEALDRRADDVDRAIFSGKYSASIHLLIGFAFELLIKTAYLLHGGSPLKLGARGLGHDLVSALDEAEELGFTSPVANLRWIVEHLREPHHKHVFRYGGIDEFRMPALELTLPALEELVRDLGAQIRHLSG